MNEHPNVYVGHYSPSGVVGDQVVKPVVPKEQYGQPESASMPPNYRSFGSWGLYIGGNPADGYYSNYYKSIDSKPSGVSQPVASFSPVVKQASSSGDYYPYVYSPAELSSGVPVHSAVSSYSPVGSVVEPVSGVSSYADFYSTKGLGKANTKANPSGVKGSQSSSNQQQQVKGYSQFFGRSVGQVPQPQVVSYSVPVGSQIVGSQPGTEGAFNPYGIHASTRYAIKPAVVSSNSYYQGYPVNYDNQVVPQGYKQQVYSPVGYYPMNYYGYPVSQIYPYGQNSPTVVSVSPAVSGSSSSVVSEVPQPSVPVVQAPPSPVQVGHAAAAHAAPSQEGQSVQEQVVDKPDSDKPSGVKQ